MYSAVENVAVPDSRFAHTGCLQSTKAERSSRNTGNSCHGQIYSVFSTIIVDTWYALGQFRFMELFLLRWLFRFFFLNYTSSIALYLHTHFRTVHVHVCHSVSQVDHDLHAPCVILIPCARVEEIWVSLVLRPRNAFTSLLGAVRALEEAPALPRYAIVENLS